MCNIRYFRLMPNRDLVLVTKSYYLSIAEMRSTFTKLSTKNWRLKERGLCKFNEFILTGGFYTPRARVLSKSKSKRSIIAPVSSIFASQFFFPGVTLDLLMPQNYQGEYFLVMKYVRSANLVSHLAKTRTRRCTTFSSPPREPSRGH